MQRFKAELSGGTQGYGVVACVEGQWGAAQAAQMRTASLWDVPAVPPCTSAAHHRTRPPPPQHAPLKKKTLNQQQTANNKQHHNHKPQPNHKQNKTGLRSGATCLISSSMTSSLSRPSAMNVPSMLIESLCTACCTSCAVVVAVSAAVSTRIRSISSRTPGQDSRSAFGWSVSAGVGGDAVGDDGDDDDDDDDDDAAAAAAAADDEDDDDDDDDAVAVAVAAADDDDYYWVEVPTRRVGPCY
eukprot:2643788-Rhodomonas_salina.3